MLKHLLFIGPILFCIGFGIYIQIDWIRYEKQLEYYEREIAECDRRIAELREESEFINYSGDDWMERWERRMIEEAMNDYWPT